MKRIAHTRSNASFEAAFRESRKAGCTHFIWNGDIYTTDLDTEVVEVAKIPVITRIYYEE